MNGKGLVIRNVILIAVCVLLAALLAGMMYLSEQSDKERKEVAEELQAQAKQYEREIAEIRSNLSQMEKSITYSGDMAEAMVGFVVSKEADLDYIKTVSEEFDFEPVVIVDCTEGLSDVRDLLDTACDARWEIMLTASSFSENVNSDVVEILSYIKDIGARSADVFLLRNDSYTNKNVQLLIDDGFVGYTKYNQSTPMAGVTDEGYVYFDYSYLQSMQTSVSDRLYSLCANKTALIVAFDMDAVNSGSVTDDYVAALLERLGDYATEGQCRIASVEEVVIELSSANKTEEERRAEYEEYAAQQQVRIDELEEIVREIYSQMG
ncbi:MAG: hypothetical protein LUG52_10395 [Clostridia bacterium]|nr:hypothetical protein [Clostridia bacterium]